MEVQVPFNPRPLFLLCYHVINRGNDRREVFLKDGDFQAFLKAIGHAWVEIPRINQPVTASELESLRRSVKRGMPYGSAPWAEATAERLGLEFTVRPRGRPRKQAAD